MLPCQAVLERNPLLYVDIIEALRRDICQVLYTDEAACLLGFPHGDKPITEFTTCAQTRPPPSGCLPNSPGTGTSFLPFMRTTASPC